MPGTTAYTSGSANCLGAPDEAVMAAAVAESPVLVSMDTEFHGLLAESNASLPSLVLFRRVGRTADE